MQDFQDLLKRELFAEGRKKGWSDKQKTTLKSIMSHSDDILKQGISEAFEIFLHKISNDDEIKGSVTREMKSKSAELRLKHKLMALEKKFLSMIDQAYQEFHKGCEDGEEPKKEAPKDEPKKDEAPKEEPHVPKTPDEMEHWVKERALHLHDTRKKKNQPEDHIKDFEDAKNHVMSYVQHTKEKPHEKFQWSESLYRACLIEAEQELRRLLRG